MNFQDILIRLEKIGKEDENLALIDSLENDIKAELQRQNFAQGNERKQKVYNTAKR